MLRDLEAHTDEVIAHPILQAFASDPSNLPSPPPDLPRAQDLDDKVLPLETFQVLDADSSQLVAIEWAKRGANFVIEGPPGTGKSQTIANIIAEVLAQNKKVLFVSAKMAALEVVAKRLDECGLGNFCLEAHSHHTSRGALVSDLGKALFETYPLYAPPLERLTQFAELRAELNAYARALHTPIAPLNQTPFHAFATIATLTDPPDLYFDLPAIGETDAPQFDAMGERLDNLTARPDVWEHQAEHPWRGIALQTYSFKARSEIEFRFGELIQLLGRLESATEALAEPLTLPAPPSLEAVERLVGILELALETPMPPSAWFRAGETTELRAIAVEAQKAYQEYA